MPTYFKPGERARYVYTPLREEDNFSAVGLKENVWSRPYNGQECTIVEQVKPPIWVRQELLCYAFKFDDGFSAAAPHYCLHKLLKGDSYKRATKSLEDILNLANTTQEEDTLEKV